MEPTEEPTPMPDVIYERSVSVICKTKEARKIAKQLDLKERKPFSRVYCSEISIECAPSNVEISRVRVLLVGDPAEDADLTKMRKLSKPSGILSPDGRSLPSTVN